MERFFAQQTWKKATTSVLPIVCTLVLFCTIGCEKEDDDGGVIIPAEDKYVEEDEN